MSIEGSACSGLSNGGVANQYVVENPNQIKSDTDNVGTYSEQSNDIKFSIKSNETPKPIPVNVAKEAISIMKEVAGFTNKSRTIFDAGIDFIKTTEWYENLSPEQQAQVDTPTFRNAVGQMIKSLNASTKKINELKNKIKSEKQSKKDAVKTITDFLNSSELPKEHITETELKRLMRRAAEVATHADMEKAIERFQEVYEKVMMNAESRETAGKKEIPVREQVDTMLASGMNEADILSNFDNKKDKEIAQDQINRSKPYSNHLKTAI